MVATVSERVSEGRVFSVFTAAAPEMYATEARAFAVYNVPTVAENISRVSIVSVQKQDSVMDISAGRVFAVIRGRVDNRKIRAFAFTLDDHEFYVLRLGDTSTLVADLTRGTWQVWKSSGLNFWRVAHGFNWLGVGSQIIQRGANTNIVLGDDTFGLIWYADPDAGVDESPREDLPDEAYERKVQGTVPMRMRDAQQLGAVYLTADFGNPQYSLGSVTLRTSDDYGKTWRDHGTISVTAGNYTQEFAWRSLGLIRAPGKLFEISDNGAFVRINSLDIR